MREDGRASEGERSRRDAPAGDGRSSSCASSKNICGVACCRRAVFTSCVGAAGTPSSSRYRAGTKACSSRVADTAVHIKERILHRQSDARLLAETLPGTAAVSRSEPRAVHWAQGDPNGSPQKMRDAQVHFCRLMKDARTIGLSAPSLKSVPALAFSGDRKSAEKRE